MKKDSMSGKLWRLTKVLYFIITIPLVLFGAGALLLLQEFHRGNYNSDTWVNDYYIGALYMILFLISYILLTDLIRRIISYINNETFEGFISYMEISKRFFVSVVVIGGILGTVLFSLSQNLRNECAGSNEGFDEHGICSCDELYVRENGSCKKDVKTYDNGEISFTYPGKLLVNNKDFEEFKFFEKENIIVKKYNFNTLIGDCISGWSSVRSNGDKQKENKLKTELIEENKTILKNIQSGLKSNNTLDHISCNFTTGPIKTTPILINGINGVLINYYFTQDKDMACLSQFNTELLLVKDLDNIYSVVFKNNFGNVINYLNQFKGEYGEACLIDFEGEFRSKVISDNIINFYKNGTSLYGTDYEGFEKNYDIIKGIINTIKIK